MLTQAEAPKAPNTKSDFCRTKGWRIHILPTSRQCCLTRPASLGRLRREIHGAMALPILKLKFMPKFYLFLLSHCFPPSNISEDSQPK